jgi:hydroxypyruvate isomerase
MPRFPRSACIEWLFAEGRAAVPERIRRAADAGVDAIEFWSWRDKDLDAVGEAAQAGGLDVVMMLVEPQVPIVDAANFDAFVAAAEESARAAAALGCRTVVTASGEALPDASTEQQDAAILAALEAGGEIAGRHGITLLFEPLNDVLDHPRFFVARTEHGLRLVEAVDSPHVRLLYDVYHSAMMGEEPGAPIVGHGEWLGHVHIADTNGRREPGTGTIDWAAVLSRLQEAGYAGHVGLEYRPSADTRDSLAHLDRLMS